VIGRWIFCYNGWMLDEFDRQTFVRDDASQLNLRPESRLGSLDVNVLNKHGCNADCIRDDPLFFYQLLFPFCPPDMSKVEGDCCMPYFSHVAMFTNIYASTCGGGIGMGHSWSNVMVPELVR
jgi:hypothetical protein